MSRFDALIFDLDGTLWDTCQACAVAWNRVLARHAISFRSIVAEDVRRVTGRPHEECIRTVFHGLPESQLRLLTRETMEEDNRAVAELGGQLYPCVESGVKALAQHYPLFIVSNCQSGYIETFLAWSGLGPHFTDIECWGNTGLTKAENLAWLILRNGLDAPLMVGDTEGDRTAAEACGAPFAFVNYGFGNCAQFDYSLNSFRELVSLLVPLATGTVTR